MNGLDLFSGIGGLTIALSEWVTPVAYCEIDPYARAVLFSRMSEGQLPIAPIWDDVKTLRGEQLPKIDIIYGGFPCQDISVANSNGKGLAGERSGLFSEIMRLTDELKPSFLFLENVPNIRNRGLDTVLKEITARGYDCRWCVLSAAEVGAPHLRKRWWLLGYSNSNRVRLEPRRLSGQSRESQTEFVNDCKIVSYSRRSQQGRSEESERASIYATGLCQKISNSNSSRLQKKRAEQQTTRVKQLCNELSNAKDERLERQRQITSGVSQEHANASNGSWWTTEPDVGRVVNGLPYRVDRIKGLGNAVVPAQAKKAFEYLWSLKA